MNTLGGFVGHLTLRLGAAQPNLLRQRAPGLDRLFVGRPAAVLPEMAASLYSLCGHAHRLAARLAIAAARGEPALPDEAERRALRWHTAREQLRRLVMDWPTVMGRKQAASAAVLARCPLLRGSPHEAAYGAVADWVGSDLLGQPLRPWLAAWERDGGDWVADWCADAPTPLAALLQRCRDTAMGWPLTLRPLRVAGDEVLLREIARQAADDAFDDAPLAHGRCAETGPWTRHAEPAPADTTLWWRLASRVADLARLAGPAGGQWLDCGSLHIAPGEGLSFVETARGVLVHHVRLDGERVAGFRSVSPTDWNFHPEGMVAQALRRVREPADAEWLVLAFDPCVSHTIEELQHA